MEQKRQRAVAAAAGVGFLVDTAVGTAREAAAYVGMDAECVAGGNGAGGGRLHGDCHDYEPDGDPSLACCDGFHLSGDGGGVGALHSGDERPPARPVAGVSPSRTAWRSASASGPATTARSAPPAALGSSRCPWAAGRRPGIGGMPQVTGPGPVRRRGTSAASTTRPAQRCKQARTRSPSGRTACRRRPSSSGTCRPGRAARRS